MDKQSIYELQLIDCNCNDCQFMKRDFIALQSHKQSYEGTGLTDNLQFGYCIQLLMKVSFIPNTCQIHTQHCFKHRKA